MDGWMYGWPDGCSTECMYVFLSDNDGWMAGCMKKWMYEALIFFMDAGETHEFSEWTNG